jgi:hypothetical protein
MQFYANDCAVVCNRSLTGWESARAERSDHWTVAMSRGFGGMPETMSDKARCLVIGIPAARIAERNLRNDEILSIDFADLPVEGALPPGLELVVAPLFRNDFDALELIDALGKRDYRGTLRIVAPRLPNRNIVLRELRSHAVRKGITVELTEEI